MTKLTFDETVSTSGVAVVNPSSTATTVSVTAWDSNGNTLGTSSISLPPFNKTEAALSQFPGLSGISGNRGSAQFNVSAGAVAVRRLRFGGSAFTSIPTRAPSAAVAPVVSSFKSGKYLGPATLLSGKTLVTAAGPGVAGNGATELSRWFRSQYSRRSSDVHSGNAGDVSRAAGNLVSSGQYVGPGTILAGKAILMANGPGASFNGTTESTLSTASGADGCTFPSSATWYAGPIANSPYAMQFQNAGITSTALSYGVASSPNCSLAGVNGDGWRPDTLIGVSQDGNTVTIFQLFRRRRPQYSVDEITYTLAQ
jgi:hypothetical protein